jgi:CheY-like chemotaxis protein
MLTRRLERAGHTVITAADGETALNAMREEQPAVVLMDMNLPVKDGWTACREAKADEAIRDIPIIALTAHAMEEDKARALAAGCTDFATKPVDFPALLSVIAAALNAHS